MAPEEGKTRQKKSLSDSTLPFLAEPGAAPVAKEGGRAAWRDFTRRGTRLERGRSSCFPAAAPQHSFSLGTPTPAPGAGAGALPARGKEPETTSN